jgi:hypothetical protein
MGPWAHPLQASRAATRRIDAEEVCVCVSESRGMIGRRRISDITRQARFADRVKDILANSFGCERT